MELFFTYICCEKYCFFIVLLQDGVYYINIVTTKRSNGGREMRSNLVLARGEKSQQDVARDIGISQKTLSALERGYRNPSVDLMKKIQSYYQLSMMTLFEDIFVF